MKAKTQVEFAKAWIQRVDALIGCFPQNEDVDQFLIAQGTLKKLILRKARTLPIPRGDHLQWAQMMIESIEQTYEETA